MSKSLKSSYGIHHLVESFFTGNQIQFDKEGEHFYCAHGSTINKVCVQDGQVKAQITSNNEDDHVIRFTLTPDEELIIIAYHSGLIMKFNLVDETIEREFKSIHTAPVTFMKTNQSGTHLATGSSDGTVKLWNLKNHYCSHNLKGVNGVISSILFHESDNGTLLFCAGGDDSIHVFDIDSSSRIAKLEKHCSTVTDMKVTTDGKRLISVGRDKIAVVWDASGPNFSSDAALRTIPLYESVESLEIIDSQVLEEILDRSLGEDQTIFATIGEEGQIKFWDSVSGANVFSQNVPPMSDDRSPGSHCFQLCLRPKHQQLLTVSTERDLFLYDLPNLKLSQQLQGHLDEILSACWFANNKYLAIACNSNDLKIMELETSKCQHLKGHNDIVLCVRAVPSDPMCLITSSKDCNILVWRFDVNSMKATVVFKATGHTHAIHAIGVLNAERIFFSGGEDTTLKRWSLVSKSKEIVSGATSDAPALVAGQTVKAHDDRIDDISVSPNDQLVATGSRDKTVKIFSAAGLQILSTLRGHKRGIHAVRFSPVDQVLVSAGDVTLRMWNLHDFTCVKTLQGHDCSVLDFTFLSSGLQLLSVGSDGNMKLWDCKTSECSKTIDAHSGNVWALSMTDEDDMLVTGGQDEKLIIWKDTTKEEQEERLANLQSQVVQEQDFMNYINKKKWKKALKMAIAMENQSKTLSVIREIMLDVNGLEELSSILTKTPLDQLNFIVECCVTWSASAKNSSVAQQTFNIILRSLDNDQLISLPSFRSCIDQLKNLTEKSFNRYERLVQQATFVDFFLGSFKLQSVD